MAEYDAKLWVQEVLVKISTLNYILLGSVAPVPSLALSFVEIF